MRVRVMLVSLGLIAGSVAIGSAPPSVAGPKPVRSGIIEGGTGVLGSYPLDNPAIQRTGCEYTVDCVAWLVSGCNPALAGKDPAVTASIVDVGALADGRTRRSLYMSAPVIPPWGLYPGAVVQFWRSSCTEVQGTKVHTLGPESKGKCDWRPYPDVECRALRIPPGAKWMTLSGYWTTAHLSWSLA